MKLNLHIVGFTEDFLTCLLPAFYTIIFSFSMCVWFDRLEGICRAQFEAGIGPCVFSLLYQGWVFWGGGMRRQGCNLGRQILLLQAAWGVKKRTMGSWLLPCSSASWFTLLIVSRVWKRIVCWRCFCKRDSAHVHIPCFLTKLLNMEQDEQTRLSFIEL